MTAGTVVARRGAEVKMSSYWMLCVLTLAGCSLSTPSAETRESASSNADPDAVAFELSRMPMAARQERVSRFRSALLPRLSHSTAGLTPHRTDTGVVVTSFEGRFGHAVMARRAASGRVEYGCFDNANAALHFVDHEAAGSK
jgi:hypothetical protein